MTELTKKLKVTRGKGYYTILKAILAQIGPQLAADANAIKAESGEFTAYNIGCLAAKYDLNFKATCEWLEESQVLPVGTYDRVKRGGLKAGEVFAAAKGAKNEMNRKRLTKEDVNFYQGMIAALAVVAAHDAENIFREIVGSADEDELIAVARADGAMKWSGLSRYRYGRKVKR